MMAEEIAPGQVWENRTRKHRGHTVEVVAVTTNFVRARQRFATKAQRSGGKFVAIPLAAFRLQFVRIG